MNARRYPRSMAEAFGPHTDDVLHPMPEQPRKTAADRALLFLAAVTAAICGLIYWGVL